MLKRFKNIKFSLTSVLSLVVLLLLTLALVLHFLGYLYPVITFLDEPPFAFTFGKVHISVYIVLKGLVVLFLLFRGTYSLANKVETHITHWTICESNRILVIKIFQICIYLIAFFIAIDILGIDLTAFTIFSGAIGIGIGFGLQKIMSNFISGLILLFEKSIEVGDLIELSDGTFGQIRQTHARYTLIETYDNKEVLVPNEDMIVSRVTNWTYTNNRARISVTVNVAYDTDLEKARQLILESAVENSRCCKDPAPECYLNEFADSSVRFLLYFWINDVLNGRYQPKSEIMFNIWRKFKANNIVMPFPQREIRLLKSKEENNSS